MTATWTRKELREQGGFSDKDLDEMLEETARIAKSLGLNPPITTVGEGDDQLLKVDDEFAKALRGNS